MARYLDRPFAVLGTAGGLVGLEVVRHLRSMGKDWPLHLFVSATSAPHISDLDNYHLLPNDQLIVQFRKDGGYGEDVLGNAEFMEILFPAIRADAAVTETYCNTSKGRRSIARSQLFQAKKTKRFVENP